MTNNAAMLVAPEARTYATRLELVETETTGKTPYRWLEGRAVPYDTWGDCGMFMERHALNSFKRSTSGNSGSKLPLMLFHDRQRIPVGVAEKWSHDDGLCGVWRLASSADAQRAADAAADGLLVGLSVGFQPQQSEWEFMAWDEWDPARGPEHKDKVTHLESRLVEVSLTPTPVFTDAGVSEVRTVMDALEIREQKVKRPERQVDAWRAWRAALESATSE
jgi:hypothetical protein